MLLDTRLDEYLDMRNVVKLRHFAIPLHPPALPPGPLGVGLRGGVHGPERPVTPPLDRQQQHRPSELRHARVQVWAEGAEAAGRRPCGLRWLTPLTMRCRLRWR
eukprot:326131-Chlamydomonas_euryale.AAC.1